MREQSVGSAVEAVGPPHILHADTLTDHGEVYRRQHWQEDETAAEDSIVGLANQPVQGYLRDVRGGPTTTGTTLPQRDFKFGDAELFDDDDVYGVTRLFDRPKLRRGAKQQRCASAGVTRRSVTPSTYESVGREACSSPRSVAYSAHCCLLSWRARRHCPPPCLAVVPVEALRCCLRPCGSQVQKAAAIREQPRLAARPCVWRSRRVPPRKLAWAPFSGDEAVQAAVQEAHFWEKVVMTPFWLNQDR
ncbi:hypothetical protein HaLaN_04816, partial [Haematococcus lacustris]